MLSIKSNIEGIENIDKVISLLNKTNKVVKLDNNFVNFIKDKVKEVLEQVMSEKLVGGTTNDEDINIYKSRNKFTDIENGFILSNDAMALPGINGHESYPFSIALAFEYGVGIVGARSPKTGAWDYDIKNHGAEGWDYTKNDTKYHTFGYEGMEIYRTITERVNSQLQNWIEEYMNRGV